LTRTFITTTSLSPEADESYHHPYIQSKTKQSSPATRHVGAWVETGYSSYSLLTSAIDGGEWSSSRPGRALPRGKDPRYPLYRRLGGSQRLCAQRIEEKSLPLPGIEPRSPGRPVCSQTLYWLSYPALHPYIQLL
jgi:hypothetical protein